MGARLRAVILLFALIGGAFAFVLHLATNLFLEQSRRLETRRFRDVVVAWVEGLTPDELAPDELDEEVESLRNVFGFDMWLVNLKEGPAQGLFPRADVAGMEDAVRIPVLRDARIGIFACDVELDNAPGVLFCRLGVRGYGVKGVVLVPSAAFTLGESPYLHILVIVAGVAWLFLGIAGFFAFTVFFVQPLRRVVFAMEQAASRSGGPYLDPEGAPEFQAIARAFNDMVKKQRTNHDRIRYQLEELRRTHQELGTARATLVRSEQLAQVGVLAAGVAHEVGNPLGLVSGYVEMLGEDGVSEDQKAEYLKRIDSALDRIQKVLRNLLDFSRQEQDEAPPVCSLKIVVSRVVDLVRPQSRFRDKAIHVDLSSDLGQVSIHSARLEQIVLNLMMNGADAVPAGGNIWLTAEKAGKMVRVRVEDDGPGIEEEDLERIFQPFVTTKSQGSGTGLGLFVCQHLVTGYGGDIFAENREEGGARFVFRLWLEDEAAEGQTLAVQGDSDNSLAT